MVFFASLSPVLQQTMLFGVLVVPVSGCSWLLYRALCWWKAHHAATQSTHRALAEALDGVFCAFLQLSIGGIEVMRGEGHRLETQGAARALYAFLPSVLYLTVGGKLVPVPFKTIVTEDTFVRIVVVAYHETDAGLIALEDLLSYECDRAVARGVLLTQ